MRAWLLAFLLAACATSTQAQRSRFLEWTVQDAAAFGKSALRHAPQAAGVSTAFLLGSRAFDPGLNDEIRAWSTGSVSAFLERTNPLGGPQMTRRAAGIFAAALLLGDTRSQDAAFTSLEAVVYAGGLSYAIKYAIGRGRPEEGFPANHFEPFSGHSSFPSGHTTAAFALITPWALYYDTPIARALYLLPVGTALARMDRDKHWATDVLAGGALGFLTARYLTRRHQGSVRSRPAARVRMAPGSASVSFRF